LLDIGLSGMDGNVLVTRLRAPSATKIRLDVVCFGGRLVLALT
jgi:hypothetical protein